jgi:hypothetical protein
MGEGSPYRSPVTDRHNAFSGVNGMNPADCPNDSILKLCERFGTRNHAPVLGAFDFEEDRISFSDLLAEDSALPLP